MLTSAILMTVLAAQPEGGELHVAAHAEDDISCPLHWHNVAGVKLIGVAAVPHDEPNDVQGQPGIGLFYERTLVRGWLELELSFNALLLTAERGAHLPVDVVFKKPFHVGHRIDPYVGVGAAATFGVGEERFVAPGIVATAGLYVWARNRVGIMAEFDYAASYEPTTWVHEFELTTGPVFRF